MSLASLIKRLEDIMRSDPGIDGTAQRLSQIVWILFLKVFDYKEEEAELDDDYRPVIPEGYRWRDWATGESLKDQRTGDELIDFVNNQLFPALRGEAVENGNGARIIPFPSTTPRALLVKEFMNRSHNYAANGIQLRMVLNLFDEVDFSDADETHEFNDVYETLLKSLQSAGKAGEFYTPRAVTSFAVKHVDPRIGETVGDFACGTAGFLVDSLRHLEQQVQPGDTKAMESLQNSLVGQEFKPLPYMLGVTNLMLHDIALPNITYGDSLDRKRLLDYEDEDCVDCIVMNPPYGGIATEADKAAFPADLRSSETADLFMSYIITRLRINGRAAVVLPNGFLEGEDNTRVAIKKLLFKQCNLHTVIRLPESVFAPYTSIDTNILFFDKTSSTQETWFYRFDKPEGYKHFSKTKPLLPQHFQLVDEWWDARVEIPDPDVEGAWKAKRYTVDELVEGNYRLDKCGYPHEDEEILPPDQLISKYKSDKQRIETEIDSLLAQIMDLIGNDTEENA
ncbi:N-6 DNA methylase [Bifidobacterium sp. SMB2]|uniref:site-specific DNA-methyltransferase (adenine-specific) n=1 Tax=Bifidobacterium saimiriisciurei TaxID=2661627 RepID=A0ABX0CDY6_9BIFI|nr:class I SAM-dependent DNA methyltransferase [Bifidobacterium saimiriisciurei]NEG95682.1 N-6 DNA methylase [Bifidobacterium sp. SMB2]NEH11109.1 N-6 DNA methylase [Bifidobacterium saimiriisciurei]